MNANTSRFRICRRSQTILAMLWGRALIGVLCVGAAIGLMRLSSALPRPRASAEYIGPPGSGTTVRTELVDIWLPRELYELARRRAENRLTLSDDTVWALEWTQQRDKHLWYALSDRLYQVDGRVAEVTTIYTPDRYSWQPDRLPELVAAIAAELPHDTNSQRLQAKLHIIPEALLSLEPRVAMAAVLAQFRNRKM
jgi:hypothetical protein